MKKSVLRLSVLALFVLAAMLLTSCGQSYSKMNVSKYCFLDEDDYTALAPEVDKVIISDEDTASAILDYRFQNRKEKEGDYPYQNPVQLYDQLGILYEAVDADGNVVESNMAWNRSASASAEYSLPSGTLLYLGYQKHVEGSLLAFLADKFLTDGIKAYDHKVDGKVQTKSEDGKISGAMNIDKTSVVYVGYTSDLTGKSKDFIMLDLTEFDPENVKGDSFEEALALGLLQLYADDESATKLTVDSKAAKIIYVNQEKTDGSNCLAYPYTDDAGNTVAFTINATVYGAWQLDQLGYNATVFETDFTYPEDAEGTYVKGEESVDKKNVDVTVKVYVLGAADYTYPEYDDTFITETMKFASADGKTGDDLKAEYEAFVKSDLQSKENDKAAKAATAIIFDTFMKGLTDENFKLPGAKVRAYVRETKDNLRYLYDSYSFTYSSKTYYYRTLFKSFEEFAVKYAFFTTATGVAASGSSYLEENSTYSLYTIYGGSFDNYAISRSAFKSESTAGYTMKNVSEELTRQGQELVKKELALRRVAELLGISITTEEFNTYVEKLYNQEIKTESDKKAMPLAYYIEYYGRDNLEGALLKTKVEAKLFELNKDTVVYNEIDSKGNDLTPDPTN